MRRRECLLHKCNGREARYVHDGKYLLMRPRGIKRLGYTQFYGIVGPCRLVTRDEALSYVVCGRLPDGGPL